MVYVWYLLLVGVGAKFASRFGYKHSIFISNIFYVAYWIILFSIAAHPRMFFVAPLFFALQKSWYWPAYNADIALGSAHAQRGREIGVLQSLIQVAFIVGPFLGGFISEQYGFLALFITASVLMIFSAYPLFGSPEIYSRHEFAYKNLWEMFRKYRRNFFGYWGFAEDLMFMSLWPIFMYMVIGDYLDLGLVSTIAAVIGTMIMLYVGRLTDKIEKRRLISWGSIFYGATWLIRFAGRSVPALLVFDALTKTGKDITSVPMTTLTYERAGDDGPDHAIAYVVFYEFSLSVGKILTALAGIAILAAGGSIFLVFALTGFMTMLYGLLK